MNGDVLTSLDYGGLVDLHRKPATCSRSLPTDGSFAPSTACLHLGEELGGDQSYCRLRGEAGDSVRREHGRLRDGAEGAGLHRASGEPLDLPDLVLRLLDAGEQVGSHLFEGYWLDIGRHEDYERAILEYESLKAELHPGPANGEPTASAGSPSRREHGRERSGHVIVAVTGGARLHRLPSGATSSFPEEHEVRSAATACSTARRTSRPRSSRRASGSFAATFATRRHAGRRSRAPTPSSTSRRSSATRPARATRSSPTRSTSRAAAAWCADAARARRGPARLRLDVLQLRPDERPERADRRDRPAQPGFALRRAEGGNREVAPERRRTVLCVRPACASRPSTARAAGCAFDLTVNEFTRDLWAGRKLDVFGELFWRPYIHANDAARAVALVLLLP